jgi:hypothetical protein
VAIVLSLPYNGQTVSEKDFVSARVALPLRIVGDEVPVVAKERHQNTTNPLLKYILWPHQVFA